MTTPTIDLLTLLQQYETLHTAANDNLKSCIWNITKARKVGTSKSCYGSLQYTVDNVREELRALALLELKGSVEDDIDEEPSLISEESSTLIDKDGNKGDSGEVSNLSKFVLHFDGMRNAKEQLAAAQEVQEQINNIVNISSLENNNTNDGLRRRYQSTITTSTQDDNAEDKKSIIEWTISEDAPTSSNNNEEEERLHQQQYTDPLNLFGIPPPALRVAQAKSRSAIAYYVEVANLAREIIRITNENGVE